MRFGEIFNKLMAESKQRTPKEGDGATVICWSDRIAGTIIEVSPSGKYLWIKEDKAIRTDENGMSDSQQYRYEPDFNGKMRKFSLRKNGEWRECNGSFNLLIGIRDHHYDYSF